MLMNINEIEAFVSILRTGGVTHAAERLHRSQPAITRRIKLLEDKIGVPLIERVRGKAVPTEAGQAFLPFAEAVLVAIKDGAEAVRALRAPEQGTIRLALVGTLAGTTVVTHLRRFMRTHPKVRIELRTANSQDVSGLVRNGEVTLGLRYFDDPSPELISEAVSTETMLVACSSDHRLAGRVVHDTVKLAGERWIGFPAARGRSDSFAQLLERQLVRAGLDGAEIVAIDSLTAQKRLVEAGFGLALVPESAIQEELRLGTLKLIRAPRLHAAVPVSVVHRRKGYLSGAARALLAIISGKCIRPTAIARKPRKGTR
jgi:DNA-binding transcriptional LysR family regulator